MSVLTAEQIAEYRQELEHPIRLEGLLNTQQRNLLDTIDSLREQIATAERRAYQKVADHFERLGGWGVPQSALDWLHTEIENSALTGTLSRESESESR